ncbi:MAG: peptidylprolyl isomerase [Chitinophagaceae bacterium]
MNRIKQLLFACFTIMAVSATAQPIAPITKKVMADKIIAQVGDKIILHSDIMNAIADFKRQGAPNIPTECDMIEGQLIQKALVLQAEKDSLVIGDDELDAALDNQIRGFINAYGSRDALEEIAGRTVYQIKEDFRVALKERKLADLMRNKVLEAVKITPNEVKAYFAKIPADSLPFYEREIEVSQIIVQPKATKEIEEYVIKQLYEYKRQIEAGVKKFEQMAKLYSDDKGTEAQGGTIPMNRTAKDFDPTFMQAAFRLKEGQISPVIKSKFGYHIILMVSRSGDDAIVRHILKIPPVTEDEIKVAINKLDTVRSKVVDQKLMDFGEAVNKYSDDENSKFNGGAIQGRDGSTFINIDALDKDLVQAIRNLKPGEVSKPMVYTDERGNQKTRIVYLKSRSEPHRENLKQDYNRISQRALEEKKQSMLETWFKEKLPNFYIKIDKSFAECKDLKDWFKYATDND